MIQIFVANLLSIYLLDIDTLPDIYLSIMKSLQRIHTFLPLITFLITGGVYIWTLAPGLSHTDSGELAGVLSSFGVAHPTGYPLFTLLGGLFLKLPLSASAVWQANLFALLCVSSGISVFSLTGREMLSRHPLKIKVKDPAKRLVFERRLLLSNILTVIAASLSLAFSLTVWQQSSSVEVYSLHFLLLSCSLYFLTRAWYEEKDEKWWLLLLLFLGLGFGNHLTTLLLLPSVLLLFWWKRYANFPFNRFLGVVGASAVLFYILIKLIALGTLASLALSFLPGIGLLFYISTPAQKKLLLQMAGVFVGVLFVQYAFLWLRAKSDPAFNWGNPSDADAFLYHFSGKQFQVWMFGDWTVFVENLERFLLNLPTEFAYGGILLAFLGLYQLNRVLSQWFVASLLAFVFTYLYVSNYGIYDLEPYFLLAYLMVGLWILWGLRKLSLLMIKKPMQQVLVWSLAGLFVLAELFLNFAPANQGQLYSYEDYSRKSINSLPADAIVITKQWNVLISQSWYLRLIDEYRPDVEVIGFTLMRDRFWYGDFLKRNHPEIAQKLDSEINLFYTELRKFAFEQPHDLQKMTNGFNQLFYGILSLQDDRPVYFSPEMVYGALQEQGLALPQGMSVVPEGYFYRLLPQKEASVYQACKMPDFSIRFSDPLQPNEELILQNVVSAGMDRASYERAFQKEELARNYLNAVKKLDPKVKVPAALQGL